MDERRRKSWDVYAKITDWGFLGNEEKGDMGKACQLKAYPSVFYEKVTILGAEEDIEIYNIAGKFVKSFPTSNDFQSKNTKIIWDGKDAFGKNTNSGVYFVKSKHSEPVKIIKIKPL